MKTKEPKREVEVINSSMSRGDANFSFNDNRTVTEDHNLLRNSLTTKDVPTDRNMPSKIDSLDEFPLRQSVSKSIQNRSSSRILRTIPDLSYQHAAMQRVIEFNEDDTIKSISIKRPTSGLQSSTTRETNYHIAAMQIGVDTAQTLIGLSYLAALEKLNEHSCNIVTFPGFLCLASDRGKAILGLLDELQISIEEARASRPTNYAANIERLLEKYIQVLDQLDFTYHESGNGAVGGDGEGPAAESFRNASASGHIDERLLIEKSLKLIDLRGWSPTVSEAAEPIGQAILKMMASYEFLADEPYLVTAIIGRFATELGLDSADLYRAVAEYVPIRF